MKESFNGPKLSSVEIESFLKNLLHLQQDEMPPVCLWGNHRIGNSELIQDVANQWNWPIVYFSPAQFEEMGDLVGLPFMKEGNGGERQSHFAAPSWVPREEGPGILLIDDFNRADDRILRGIMPLLLNKALVSWQLPKKWVIILTANPDGGNYSVTPTDDAILTRMIHLEMVFEPKAWALWAEKQNYPGDAIGFVLSHSELINGQRTTPRTLSWFFELWKKAGLPSVEEPYLKQLAHSCLDPAVATAFIQYLKSNDIPLPESREILEGTVNADKTLASLNKDGFIRNDRIHLLCTRMLNYLALDFSLLSQEKLSNLESFLLSDHLPTEQSLLFMRSLSTNKHPVLEQLMKNIRLAELCIGV